jgi:Putative Flp pilus-assembly TadE/G-like
VLFAILLPLFLLTGAIVIDVGYWWANGRKAQIAADACALAAARELPQNWDPPRTSCVFDGEDYVLTNIPDQSAGADAEPLHVSTEVLSPYAGNATQVEATVKMKVQTFFGRFVGLGGVNLTRRAVAEQSVGEGNYAIYAHSPGCPANGSGNSLLFNGENHAINGRVHSNGEYRINNSGSDPFWAEEGTMVGCLTVNPPGTAHFGGSSYDDYESTSPNAVAPQTWPAWWTPAEFGWSGSLDASDTCDVKGKAIEIKEDGGGTRIEVDSLIGSAPAGGLGPFPGATIPRAYTYCAWEKFTINRQGLTATMTVLAPEMTINQNDLHLTAHDGTAAGDMLFFAVPNIDSQSDGSFPNGNPVCDPTYESKELVMNAHNTVFEGIIFAPCVRVKVNGDDNTGSGTILGWEVEVNGANFSMTGDSNFGGTVILALDQ